MEFQSYAYGKNHFTIDGDLHVVLSRYWQGFDAHREEMARWGALMGSEAYEVGNAAAPCVEGRAERVQSSTIAELQVVTHYPARPPHTPCPPARVRKEPR